HPEVARALGWLERHFAEPDALEGFYRTVGLSPNHFRLLFRRHTGETVQEVLARLRLRRARYLVRETGWPMKRIAAETGFADPLYFSGQYRRFWGRTATEDRAGGGVA
ncbi:MAG: helix-turn-helix domain-containing protein, partial [Verrucomicrobiota bacterium]